MFGRCGIEDCSLCEENFAVSEQDDISCVEFFGLFSILILRTLHPIELYGGYNYLLVIFLRGKICSLILNFYNWSLRN